MLHIFKYLFFIFCAFFFTNAMSAETEWSNGSESKVRLISPSSHNNNLSEIYLGLEYQLQEGWKTYWKSPGDGGFPQEITWSNSENIKALEIFASDIFSTSINCDSIQSFICFLLDSLSVKSLDSKSFSK